MIPGEVRIVVENARVARVKKLELECKRKVMREFVWDIWEKFKAKEKEVCLVHVVPDRATEVHGAEGCRDSH